MPTQPKLVLALRPDLATTPEAWSEEVRDIMGRPAPWLLRSGSTVLTAAMGILIILSCVIHYPDTISARATLTGTHPIVEVIARQSGHLADLRVKEKQPVKTSDILAIIRSPSDAPTVLRLKDQLNAITPILRGDEGQSPTLEVRTPQPAPAQPETRRATPVDDSPNPAAALAVLVPPEPTTSPTSPTSPTFTPQENLGKLAEPYSNFLTAWRHWHTVRADDYAEKSAALLTSQLQRKRAQVSSMQQQATGADRELQLANEKFERMKLLHQRDSISTAQIQEQEQLYLAEQRKHAATHKNVSEEEIAAVSLEKALADLQHERSETLRLAQERLRESANKLRADIDLWESDYVLRAPADGLVAFHDFWSDQQFVTATKQVFIIVPQTNSLIARMSVTGGGTGKVRKDQPVRIRLDDYPFKEFGIVTGRVQSISQFAREGASLVLVELEYPLRTSYRRELPFKQEMAGQADIITDDMRIIGRVFNEIRRAFNQTTN